MTQTDPHSNPGYVDPRYLQTVAERVAPLKRRSYQAIRLVPGQHVLDLGCGPATDTLALAEIVGAEGRVVGVDYDQQMVTLANQRALEAGLASRVRHEQADAAALPFPDNSFDAARSERLFQHLDHPAQALAEMVRVTRPGGRIVVVDTDHGSLVFDCPEIELAWQYSRVHAANFKNGYSGRQLYRLFREQGLADVEVEIYPLVVTDYAIARYLGSIEQTLQCAVSSRVMRQSEADRMRDYFEQADAANSFFGFISMVLVAGSKPV